MSDDVKSKFNMSQLILYRIGMMQNRAADYYRKGMVREWYFEWKNIKLQIIGKLGPEERERLTEMELEVVDEKSVKQRMVLMEDYMIYLQDLIEAYEIGLVNKGDDTIFS